MLFFYILGCVLKGALEIIEKQNTPEEPVEEDEMIEKGAEEEAPENEEVTEE